MQERNQFIESDGLFFESETHEWFHDKTSTQFAHKNSVLWGTGEVLDGLPHLVCFVTRRKEDGEYDRVVMDKNTNQIVYDTKSLEELGFYIDKLKVAKRFA